MINEKNGPLVGIPKVRVLDKNGKELLRGWYVFHKARQLNPLYEHEPDRLSIDEAQHLVIYSASADWNVPRELKIVKITPPETIEIITDEWLKIVISFPFTREKGEIAYFNSCKTILGETTWLLIQN